MGIMIRIDGPRKGVLVFQTSIAQNIFILPPKACWIYNIVDELLISIFYGYCHMDRCAQKKGSWWSRWPNDIYNWGWVWKTQLLVKINKINRQNKRSKATKSWNLMTRYDAHFKKWIEGEKGLGSVQKVIIYQGQVVFWMRVLMQYTQQQCDCNCQTFQKVMRAH